MIILLRPNTQYNYKFLIKCASYSWVTSEKLAIWVAPWVKLFLIKGRIKIRVQWHHFADLKVTIYAHLSLVSFFLTPLFIFTAGAMFMCRLCNLFSPSHTQLLAHCAQLHSQHEPPDDIIITLQPLAGEPAEMLAGGFSIITKSLLLSHNIV